MKFLHNNKTKVLAMELDCHPQDATRLADDCYLVVDQSGAMLLLLLGFEKDRYNVNRISQCQIGRAPGLEKFSVSLVSAFRRPGAKFGSYVVLLAVEQGPSWIVRSVFLYFCVMSILLTCSRVLGIFLGGDQWG